LAVIVVIAYHANASLVSCMRKSEIYPWLIMFLVAVMHIRCTTMAVATWRALTLNYNRSTFSKIEQVHLVKFLKCENIIN
jgi:hypothetical protein